MRPSQSGVGLQVHSNVALPVASNSSIRNFTTSVSAPDFTSNAVYGDFGHPRPNVTLPTNVGGHRTPSASNSVGSRSALEVDYSLAPRGVMTARSRSGSPYGPEYHHRQIEDQYGVASQSPHPFGQFGLGQRSNSIDPLMTTLDSFGTRGMLPGANGRTGYESELSAGLEVDHYARNSGIRLHNYQMREGSYGHQPQHHLHISQSVDSLIKPQYARPSLAYARSGYTPTEECIMRSHTERSLLAQPQRHTPEADVINYHQQHVERYGAASLDLNRLRTTDIDDVANIGVGMRGYRAQASLMSPSAISASDSNSSIPSFNSAGTLRMGGGFGMQANGNGTSEQDHHARSASLATLKASRISREFGSYPSSQRSTALSPFFASPSSSATQNFEGSSTSLLAESEASSVASPYPNDTVISAYPQHTSAAHMRSTTLPQHRQSVNAVVHAKHSSMSMPKQNLSTPQHPSVARLGSNSVMAEGPSETIYESEGQEIGVPGKADCANPDSRPNTANATGKSSSATAGTAAPLKAHYSSSTIFGDVDQSSPLSPSSSLISPTLTYASQSPSTLSPATPFFGSFISSAEAFEKAEVDEKQHHQGRKRGQGVCVIGNGVKTGSR